MSDTIPVALHEADFDKLKAAFVAVDAALPPSYWGCASCGGRIDSGMALRPSIFAGGSKGNIVSATIYVRCEPCAAVNAPLAWEPPTKARTKELAGE